jgi:hypothetical protein
VHEKFKTILRLQTGLCDAWVSYSQTRATRTIRISDVVAGFATVEYDWCSMADFLKVYAQHQDVLELNTERTLSFTAARSRLGSILDQPLRDITLHIFWSPRDSHREWCQDFKGRVAGLRGLVDTLTQQGQVPYICLDIIALKEWDRQNSVEECDELINSLQAFGGIVERSETFWAERMQHFVYWDTLQGVVVDRAKDSRAKGPWTNPDAIDSSLE